MNIVEIIDQELTEMIKRGKNLHWTGRNPKGKIETGKQAFARERDMNPETYALRKQVMNYIYRAKKLLREKFGYDLFDFQRIRIIDADTSVFVAYEGKYVQNLFVGCASTGGNEIYIPANSLDGKYDVQGIVYHELLHSAFCMKHDPETVLMSPYVPALGKYSPEQLDEELIKEVIKSGKVKKM
jgi:hypothetical protein